MKFCSLTYVQHCLWLLGTGFSAMSVDATAFPDSFFPEILESPTNRVALVGETVEFRVLADGLAPLSYQWFRNGVAVEEGTGSTFAFVAESGDNGSLYWVTVSNPLSEVETDPVTLTVLPGITMTASLNSSAEANVFRGWPMLLEVGLLHPDAPAAGTAPILISAGQGPWSGAIKVEVRDQQEALMNWPFQFAAPTNSVLQLTSDSAAKLYYWIAPQDTAQLAPGDYQLDASLNTTGATAPGVWKGEAAATPVTIALGDEPATLTEDQFEEKQKLFANYYLLQQNLSEAQSQIDQLLAQYPENIGGWSLRAGMLADRQPKAALDACNRALQIIQAKFPTAKEPPEALLGLRSALQQQLGSIQISATVSANGLTLSWPVVTGVMFRLEKSNDLRSWLPLDGNIVTDQGLMRWTGSASTGTEFYRLIIE